MYNDVVIYVFNENIIKKKLEFKINNGIHFIGLRVSYKVLFVKFYNQHLNIKFNIYIIYVYLYNI